MSVDDSWLVRLSLENQLSSIKDIKKNVISFDEGKSAFDHFLKTNKTLTSDNIHLIITDYDMPGMNGIELT